MTGEGVRMRGYVRREVSDTQRKRKHLRLRPGSEARASSWRSGKRDDWSTWREAEQEEGRGHGDESDPR